MNLLVLFRSTDICEGEDKNKLIVDPYAAEIVKEIFGMKMDGMSQQAIADELNSLGSSFSGRIQERAGERV